MNRDPLAPTSDSDGGWSRRTFVKSAAAIAAAPVLAGYQAASARAAQPNSGAQPAQLNTKPLKLGLIGCGGRGTGAAVQALRADPNTTLVSMGDVFEDRLKSSLSGINGELGDQAASRVQVPPERQFTGFDSYQKVIDSGVDFVLLTGYPAFRPTHLKAAIAAGKHVFAEKPLAVDAPGIRSVIQTAEEAKRKNLALLVGFCWRHNDGMRATFEQLNKGTIGDIVTAHTTYHTSTLGKHPRKPEWSDMEFQMRNWIHFTWISGDHIVEQAVHSIDRLAWSLSDRLPVKVNCLGGRAARSGLEHGNAFDHFAAIYEYDGGMRCFHSCRQIDGCPSDNTDYVYGTKGAATINGWTPTYDLRDRAGKELWKYTGRNDRDMYQNEHDELFKSIREGHPINDCARAANSTLMAVAARMSAYTGQTISWEQALNSTESLVPDTLAFGNMPTPPVAIPGQTKFA
jgi:myo-inositol 2-dehydrogenase/D-chiro-inositol 1-dehydrogenase